MMHIIHKYFIIKYINRILKETEYMILDLGCGTGLTSLTTPYNIFYHIGFHILRSTPLADTINLTI